MLVVSRRRLVWFNLEKHREAKFLQVSIGLRSDVPLILHIDEPSRNLSWQRGRYRFFQLAHARADQAENLSHLQGRKAERVRRHQDVPQNEAQARGTERCRQSTSRDRSD